MHLPYFTALLVCLFTTPFTHANTRVPDPGALADTACTIAILGEIPDSNLMNNTLLLWPHDSCCTTTDCQLQDFECPNNEKHEGAGGDVCCYKAGGDGAEAGICRCGIDEVEQGTCF
ncbi:hypothetical protein B0A50_01834 [Salinomyces thailandicus]|uniref:Uncharacterized protein n=1 Tax=Salinomyces thailandicus TaxID=706561 RepID=A0A4U0UB99_9PEZI|nr:hypothetical protein B0A50_01834 [Salinomyces thailandica]